jgi:hypothetical protein
MKHQQNSLSLGLSVEGNFKPTFYIIVNGILYKNTDTKFASIAFLK